MKKILTWKVGGGNSKFTKGWHVTGYWCQVCDKGVKPHDYKHHQEHHYVHKLGYLKRELKHKFAQKKHIDNVQ